MAYHVSCLRVCFCQNLDMEETTRIICNPVQYDADDIKHATLLLATIQEAKDRIQETKDRVSQIEYLFLTKIYSSLQSKFESLKKFQDEWKSKETNLLLQIETLRAENQQTIEENRSLKLDREKPSKEKEEKINQLRDEVTSIQLRSNELERMLDQKSKEIDERTEVHNKVLEVVRSKDRVIVSIQKQLKESEESRNVAVAKVTDFEKRVGELQEGLREKIEQVAKGNELKRNLFKKIELQTSEILNNEKLLNDQEEEKKLMLAKLKCVEENVGQLQKDLLTKNEEVEDCVREKKLLLRKMIGLEEKVNELQEDLRAGEAAKRRDSMGKFHQEIESITSDLLAERKKYGDLTAAYKSLKSQHTYLRTKYGLTRDNMLPQNKLEDESDILRNDQNPSTFHGMMLLPFPFPLFLFVSHVELLNIVF